jgi:hypothetical protein
MTLMMKREITKGHLPRIRLEYVRLEIELHSLNAELSNTVLIYQGFCDRTLVRFCVASIFGYNKSNLLIIAIWFSSFF